MAKPKVFKKGPLALNIIQRRKARGFKSAEKFAEALGIPYGTIRDIEAGYSEGQPETKETIAKFFKCTVSDLYASDSKEIEKASKTEQVTNEKILEILDERLPKPSEIEALKAENAALKKQIDELTRIPGGLIKYLAKKPHIAKALMLIFTGTHKPGLLDSFGAKIMELASSVSKSGSRD